jgi:hypothetical protein
MGAALGAAAATQLAARPASEEKLIAWMYMIIPIDQWLDDYVRTFDAWEAGGVRGLVIGPLTFYKEIPRFEFSYARAGDRIPTYVPDAKIYQRYGLDAPPPPAVRDQKKEKQLQDMIANAAARGWQILFFGPGNYGRARTFEQDPLGALALAAGAEDTMKAFPQASGVLIDGGGEHHYELAFHHGGELLEIREGEKPLLQHLGIDVARMQRGVAHLKERMHSLTPSMVRYYARGGMMGGLSLFDVNEDVLYWLRARQEVTMKRFAEYKRQIDQINPRPKFATITRATSFSLLTTQDYARIHPYFDILFHKHYFWNRGFDGMYGTIARWVRTLGEWNPGLSEADCFKAVECWFGLKLPGIKSIADMDEKGFPEEFFSKVVYSETRRALDAVPDPNKVIAWVSTGRNPHAGDPMPARDLHRMLTVSQEAGLKRFIYHPDLNLGAEEWSVISRLCGKPWKEDPSGYWPPDTPKPSTWNGGRKPK